MNIELPTGKTLYISTYEYLFVLKDEDMDGFYQSCIADDLGTYVESPFSSRTNSARLELEDVPEFEEIDVDISI